MIIIIERKKEALAAPHKPPLEEYLYFTVEVAYDSAFKLNFNLIDGIERLVLRLIKWQNLHCLKIQELSSEKRLS